MDIEKLIERLNAYSAEHQRHGGITAEAADAISTLRAENAQLRAELEYEREHADAYYEECGQWEAENEKLRAELKEAEMKIDSLLDEGEKVAFYPFGVEKED